MCSTRGAHVSTYMHTSRLRRADWSASSMWTSDVLALIGDSASPPSALLTNPVSGKNRTRSSPPEFELVDKLFEFESYLELEINVSEWFPANGEVGLKWAASFRITGNATHANDAPARNTASWLCSSLPDSQFSGAELPRKIYGLVIVVPLRLKGIWLYWQFLI